MAGAGHIHPRATIDEQTNDTMWEAGISFLASQILLAWFIWRFSGDRPGEKLKNFPGGAKAVVWAAFLLVGTEVLALGRLWSKGLGQRLPDSSRGQRDAGAGASRTIRLLFSLSRTGWNVWRSSPRDDQ